uniref:Uncharacterized protein n=1 Tax=Anguilla anguilla TaxID=7936 RepID=A0A0E9SWA4_ANGAN
MLANNCSATQLLFFIFIVLQII